MHILQPQRSIPLIEMNLQTEATALKSPRLTPYWSNNWATGPYNIARVVATTAL
jgi:hypothetical protein